MIDCVRNDMKEKRVRDVKISDNERRNHVSRTPSRVGYRPKDYDAKQTFKIKIIFLLVL